MTDLRKAAEQALEALEMFCEHGAILRPLETKETLRQALAQPEQEPVAWMHNFIEGNVIAHKPADISRYPDRWTALYKDQTLKEKNT